LRRRRRRRRMGKKRKGEDYDVSDDFCDDVLLFDS